MFCHKIVGQDYAKKGIKIVHEEHTAMLKHELNY